MNFLEYALIKHGGWTAAELGIPPPTSDLGTDLLSVRNGYKPNEDVPLVRANGRIGKRNVPAENQKKI